VVTAVTSIPLTANGTTSVLATRPSPRRSRTTIVPAARSPRRWFRFVAITLTVPAIITVAQTSTISSKVLTALYVREATDEPELRRNKHAIRRRALASERDGLLFAGARGAMAHLQSRNDAFAVR
jgi:hypothetical protein